MAERKQEGESRKARWEQRDGWGGGRKDARGWREVGGG